LEKKKPKKNQSTQLDDEYTLLLDRVFQILSDNQLELTKTQRKQILPPPELGHEGAKKTIWTNFQATCDVMNRQVDHVLGYVKVELGTTASIDAKNQLVIKGRFTIKQIESVLRHYVIEYGSCGTCKSPDTILKKEERLYFIQCKSCGSARSVAPIQPGFVAQVGKRRNK